MVTGYDAAKATSEALKTDSNTIVLEEKKEQETGLVKLDEKYFTDNARLGMEQIQPEDLATPTLTIIQPNNKLVDDSGRPYARGKFYYSGTKEIFDTVNVSFLVFSKADLPSYDDKDVLVRNYIYYGAIMPGTKLFKLYLRSTGIGKAKKFNSEVLGTKKPMFSLEVTLSTEFIKGDKGEYYVIEFKLNGVRENPEEILLLEELARQFGEEVNRGQEIVPAEDLPF